MDHVYFLTVDESGNLGEDLASRMQCSENIVFPLIPEYSYKSTGMRSGLVECFRKKVPWTRGQSEKFEVT